MCTHKAYTKSINGTPNHPIFLHMETKIRLPKPLTNSKEWILQWYYAYNTMRNRSKKWERNWEEEHTIRNTHNLNKSHWNEKNVKYIYAGRIIISIVVCTSYFSCNACFIYSITENQIHRIYGKWQTISSSATGIRVHKEKKKKEKNKNASQYEPYGCGSCI